MELNITFRHSDPSDPLKKQIETGIQKLSKYFIKAVQAHVILNVEKSRHIAEITLSENHHLLTARADSHDMYESVMTCLGKLERQVRKMKEKTKSHHL